MIISITLVVLFLVLAVIFLMGKGDKLIAGYNTASEEEKKEVNIKRLRILMAIICVITAGMWASSQSLPTTPVHRWEHSSYS